PSCAVFFFFITWPPPRSPLFPFTTLFRSSLMLRESLQAPCSGAHQPTPWVRPEMSLISLAWTHLPSSGMGAGPWYAPLVTGHMRSEEHTSELQSRFDLVCRLLLEKKKAHS